MNKNFPSGYKLYFQTLTLPQNPSLIEKYKNVHAPGAVWPEITKGIREVGIEDMQIFLYENHCLMIVKTPVEFNWDKAMKELSTLQRQAEWEAYVSAMQGVDPEATSDEKWKMRKPAMLFKDSEFTGKLINDTYSSYVCFVLTGQRKETDVTEQIKNLQSEFESGNILQVFSMKDNNNLFLACAVNSDKTAVSRNIRDKFIKMEWQPMNRIFKLD